MIYSSQDPATVSSSTGQASPQRIAATSGRVTRILKMPIRSVPMDEDESSEVEGAAQPATQAANKPSKDLVRNNSQNFRPRNADSAKGNRPVSDRRSVAGQASRPVTLSDQLRHCLRQYDILKSQLLCAELTNTTPPDEAKFQQTAGRLISRIKNLRQQIAAKAETHKTNTQTQVAASASKPSVSKIELKPAVPRRARQAVQLSLAVSTAKILKAFADLGKSPSLLVERALWADQDVRDAALLLKLERPSRTTTQK